MSKIAKALEKYRQERNRSSAELFNLDDSKLKESLLKEGTDRSIPESVDADTPKQSAQPHPSQPVGIEGAAAASREILQRAETDVVIEPERIQPRRKPHLAPAGRQPEKMQSGADENRDPGSFREHADTVLPEPVSSVISLERVDPNLVSVVNPQSLETAIFKVLRGKILFPVSGKKPRSILVTSAVPGEGKSFIAANLAVNVAQNIEDHVLLLDCDLRRPTVHRMFGLGRVKGLSDYLVNGGEIPDLLVKTGLGKLSLLPSGTPLDNPSEILSSARMASLLDELKSRYQDRFLIIESPPLMLAPETAAIARRVDGIIVVIKFGSTPMDAVEDLIDNLGKEKIIGAIVNRFDARTTRYHRYHQYSKYYRG